MLNPERILNQDRQMRAMTGLNRKAFEELLASFTTAYQQSLFKTEVERKRAFGGGRKATLGTMAEKLLYILLYCKCYPTFDLLSVLFNFDRSCAHEWVHRLLPILETALGCKQALPVGKLRSMEEFLERFPEVKEVILDGTERPVQRPKDAEMQKDHYSGKKKRHTRKHNKRQLDEEDLVGNIPDKIPVEGDLGFQGLQNEFDNIHLPHKKPRGKELTAQQVYYRHRFPQIQNPGWQI
jgi:Helix-turn-helix of DDE superfamily endonuclease